MNTSVENTDMKKINARIILANYDTMKYVSLIVLGFSIFSLAIDTFAHDIAWSENIFYYQILDVILGVISSIAVYLFWIIKNKSEALKKAISLLFPYFILIWSAVICILDFEIFGLTSYIVTLMISIFFAYLKPKYSIFYILTTNILLLVIVYFIPEWNNKFFSIFLILLPISIFSFLLSYRNYKTKVSELLKEEKILEMNQSLQFSNDNLEKEVEKRTNEIKQALVKAEESNKLKSAFLANMSHEIRTPMNGILGFAQLLKEPHLSDEMQQDYIKIIERSGERMLSTINSIIEISKIDSGILEVEVKEANINSVIDTIYTYFKPDAEKKGLDFTLKCNLPENKAQIIIDKEKIITILSNLIKNAIKFTVNGGIEVGYELVENKKAGGSDEQFEATHSLSLRFYVKDSGIGIPAGRQEAIFERFIKADLSDKKAHQGAGLGLAISRSYVEIMGGKISVESEEGNGSIFTFTIPFIQELQEKIDFGQVNINPPEKSKLKLFKLIIAEDDEVSALYLTEIVQDLCSEIHYAKTGIEALELCKKIPDTDLILMDIKMPDMDGYEAVQAIREFNKDVIIIGQSAYGLFGDREKAISAGCNEYITKPLRRSDLVKMIRVFLGT